MTYSVFGFVFLNFLNELKEKDLKIGTSILIVVGLALFINFATITNGYHRNNWINQYNDNILKESAKKIKNGDDIKKIELIRLNNDLYSAFQPYMENTYFIVNWMKEYYDIPYEVEIVYN